MKPYKNFLKRLCLLISIATIAGPPSGWSQSTGVYLPISSSIFIPSGASAAIWGDTLQLNGRLGMADSSSVLYFKGNVWRNDTAAVINGGKVIMNATALQTIIGMGSYSGTGVSFSRLEIDNPAGVSLGNSNVRIDSQIVFSKGVLFTHQNDVLLGQVAVVSQIEPTSFASVEEGGGLTKFLASNSPFLFPVGCNDMVPLYNPLQLNISAANYNASSYARVTMTDDIHDKKSPRHTNYGEKFWSVTFRNITIDSAVYIGQYNDADLFMGDKTKVTGSVWANGKWSYNATGKIPGAALAITGKVISDADIFGQDMLLQADVKVILQGAWNGSAMTTTLRTNNLVPLAQPYGDVPYSGALFNYAGTENRIYLPPNAVDWVLLELRSTATGIAVARSAGLLLNDGTVTDGFTDGPVEFAAVADGNYYVIVKHRNHLGVMSAAPIALPNAKVYDFTTALNKGYGTGTQMGLLSGGKFGLHGGNVIPDAMLRATGPIAVSDYQKILLILGGTPFITNVYNQADVNMNGIVRATGPIAVSDYQSLLSYLGTSIIFNQSF